METDNIKIYCPKCGSELDLSNGQLLGSCSFCDSLIPLPFFVTNPHSLDNETIKNMLNRIDKINDYSKNYQFHRAFNLYDKLIKNNYNVDIEDFYPYWGKVLSQYGVVYSMNDLLKSELVTLNIRDESIFENEFYKQAIELCESNTFQIIKKEASLIDNFQKELKKELLISNPVDICLLVDTRSSNEYYEQDLMIAKKLQEKLCNYNVEITDDLFRLKKVEEDLEKKIEIVDYLEDAPLDKDFIIKYNRYLMHAKIMIVISNSAEHLNENLYRHIWMSYFNLDELKDSIKDRMFIYTTKEIDKSSLPIKDLSFYDATNLDELSKNVVISIAKLSNNLPSIFNIDIKSKELLSAGKFDEIKNRLNDKLAIEGLNYQEWWMMFLVRHQIRDLKTLETRVIDPLESFYYHKTYLAAPRHVKMELFEYQKHTQELIDKLSVVDEKYENEVKINQIRHSKHEIAKIISSMIPCLISTLLCYWTFSISNTLQLIFTFIVLFLGYYLLIKKIFHVFSLGKVPDTITTEAEKVQYYHHLRQALTPEQAFLFLPNKFIKKIKAVALTVFVICMTCTLSYFVKESVVKIMHPSISYYYVFSDVVITGGTGENIIIPKEVAGRTVSKVADNAFNNNQNIKTVIISNGVKQIGKNAFKDCKKLTEVTVPASIQRLNGAPFEGCNSMKIFIYQGTIFSPDNFLGPNYQEEMFELNIQR